MLAQLIYWMLYAPAYPHYPSLLLTSVTSLAAYQKKKKSLPANIGRKLGITVRYSL